MFFSDYGSGVKLTIDQSKKRKALQSHRGWPDLFIPNHTVHKLPDGTTKQYSGLFLELKIEKTAIYVTRGNNKGKLVADIHIREQAAMLQILNSMGYIARFAVGYDQAIRMIDWYFNKPDNATLF